MIRIESDAAGLSVIHGDLPMGSIAYIDADWINADAPGEVPALVADPKGIDGGDAAASAAVIAVAQEAAQVAASRSDGSGPIEVHGHGIVSELIRAILSDQTVMPATGDDPRPAAIVDATGDPVMIVEMTRRLADRGTLVLVGEPLGRSLGMELYPDVHVRGLRLVGVASPRLGDGVGADKRLVELANRALCQMLPDQPLPAASWYAVSFSPATKADSGAEHDRG